MQREATGDLYVLLSLCRTEEDDGLALVRYNARGMRLSVEPFGLNNGRQERGVALFLRPEGGVYIVAETHQPPHQSTTPPADDAETLVYAYPGVGTPVFVRAGTPTNTLLLGGTLYWAANPPEVVRFSPSQSAFQPLQDVDRLLGLSANVRSGLLSTYGWIGTPQGRRGAFLVTAAPDLPATLQTVGGSFGYVAEAFPIAPGNLLILRGAANETQARMYHEPSGLEADKIELRVSYGDTLYLYLLATEPEGGATLVRLNPATQTRLWTVSLPSTHIGAWTVDAEHRVHLLENWYRLSIPSPF
ncbi:MAG: hypothetical protein RMJ83_09740 [Armatimonadota bacterium]|nr:hypothetical protein [Armatimonadota bacterium]